LAKAIHAAISTQSNKLVVPFLRELFNNEELSYHGIKDLAETHEFTGSFHELFDSLLDRFEEEQKFVEEQLSIQTNESLIITNGRVSFSNLFFFTTFVYNLKKKMLLWINTNFDFS
jgi:hypothetical protein